MYSIVFPKQGKPLLMLTEDFKKRNKKISDSRYYKNIVKLQHRKEPLTFKIQKTINNTLLTLIEFHYRY